MDVVRGFMILLIKGPVKRSRSSGFNFAVKQRAPGGGVRDMRLLLRLSLCAEFAAAGGGKCSLLEGVELQKIKRMPVG